MSLATRERRPAGPSVRLVGASGDPAGPVVPDPAQARLVGRRQGSGPVVVFGAPGTGKTTMLVEAVAARVRRDGLGPGSVLAVAPTRLAAARLRERLAARIGGTVQEPVSRTPHSYAFGLLHRAMTMDDLPAPRLISGPEQDRMLADLLAGHAEGLGSAPSWPDATGDDIRQLRGFRDELRDLLMRAVERGLTPDDLLRYGQRQGRPDWVAAASVMAEYLDVTALSTPGAYDPAGIVDAATELLLSDDELLDAERGRRRLVVVDDAHELTVAAEHLLRLVAGGGRDILLAGDPDSATQTFRGARPNGLAEAVEHFRRADGSAAEVITFGTVHRHGAGLRSVASRVASRIGAAGKASHRSVEVATANPAGTAEVRVFASPAREGAYIAQYLRRLHLEQQVPWQRMAVIVRSTKATSPLRRALGAAGVPVAIPTAEVPVRDEIAVVPLRLALRCALRPESLTAEVAAELLTSPIGGADAIAVRRLRQALRTEEIAGGGGRASDALLVEALAAPAHLAALEPRVSAPARRVADVLSAGREAAAAGDASPETVLWAVWDRTQLAVSWRRAALSGGPSGARADRDLDAVMALFEAAARFTDRFPGADAQAFLAFLEAQDVPADTLAERAPADESVALVTATGAAGLEWDVVAVAGVQEGVWPDLRLRDSLLGGQRLADAVDGRGDAGFVAQRKAIHDDELRLFHVAVSRPRSRLLVTAVRSDEVMPSTFLDLVDPDSADQEEIRPLAEVPRMMTLPALVAQLRAVVVDALAASSRREAAARQLARLALAGVPGADPAQWYGLAPVSVDAPLRESQVLVRVSPSQVDSFDRCSMRWLLDASGGRRTSSTAQGLGELVHELAEQVPDGNLIKLQTLLAERFSRLGLGHGWVADTERARAEKMVARLAQYTAQARAAGRELVATEQSVQVDVGRARIVGKVDRLERDEQGRLVVVDLKTGKSAPTRAEVARHAQLGVYQVAIEEGGFARAVAKAGLKLPEGAGSGGAALVQLGKDVSKVSVQQQVPLSRDAEPGWASDLVQGAAEGMASGRFPAKTNGMCRVCDLRRACPLQNEGRQVGR
ncbi:ATP-dependent helicase [Kineosporia sp. J2-2]|uniref:DNA 3'-5' helicase n=1 Tax=Kineosporia corallincola TaxID=2835133 RepID=A0ABS5TGZ8_9ACTN|nr:ATP-dependent DNA helicase [Kineosporia corallincola]MBT0770367.1 ATP-dependent helicase [Kineosporia corallincola]